MPSATWNNATSLNATVGVTVTGGAVVTATLTPTGVMTGFVTLEENDGAGWAKIARYDLSLIGPTTVKRNAENTVIRLRLDTVIVGAGSVLALVTSLPNPNVVTSQPPTDGQLLIGDTAAGSYDVAPLTAGANVTIVDGPGSITISSTAGGGTDANASISVNGADKSDDFIVTVNQPKPVLVNGA